MDSIYQGLKRLDDATPEEWDKAAKSVGWGGATVDVHGIKSKSTEWGESKEELLKASYYRKPSSQQVGGTHYKKFKIQPAEFCYKNDIPYLEATVIKYLCRWKDKGGIQDLEKAKHFIDLLIEFENANNR